MTESTMTANNKNDQNILSFVLFDDDDDDEHDSFINTDILDITQSLKRSYATYIHDDSLSHGNCQSVARTKKPGRKPMIDTDEDEEKIKRKEQNRAAQRAFRERKERYVRELEKKFKQFQDKHAAAIHQLLQENQYLRSVICRLEVENCVLKGTPADSVDGVIKALEKARTSLPVPPPPSPAAFQLSTKPPLPPLQIRPSSMKAANQNIDESTKPANNSSSSSSSHSSNNNNTSSRRNNRKTNANHQARVVETKLASENATQLKKTTTTTTATITDIPDRDFTFSITTPALLRATSDRSAGNEQVQAVQLYPDHSHPANPLFRKDRKKQQPENNNPINEPVNDDQDKGEPSRTDDDGNNQNNDQEFDNFLKPFLEIHDDLCTNGIVNSNTNNNNDNNNNNNNNNNNRNPTALPTERRSSNNDRYQEPTSRIWQRVSEHASNPKFSVDQLLHAVKRSTMLTDDRLVLEEWDMEQMLENF